MRIRSFMTMAIATIASLMVTGACQAAFVVTPTSVGGAAAVYGSNNYTHQVGDNAYLVDNNNASNNDFLALIDSIIPGLNNIATDLYKYTPANANPESGIGSPYYAVTSLGSAGAPASGNIVNSGIGFIDAAWKFLVVKDGNLDSYVFNISSWNGVETINFSNFFGQQGKLSHLSIFAYDASITDPPDLITEVPEPASMALWMTAAVGGAFFRRRRKAVC